MASKVRPRHLPEITYEELTRLLSYDEGSGQFVWKVRCGRSGAGTVAGKRQSGGYTYIRIGRRDYGAHRLAWLYRHGALPDAPIDHINGLRDDNRMANLRKATTSQNTHHQSTKSRSASGLKGVRQQCGSWCARIGLDGKQVYLGTFATKEEAHAAYLAASQKIFGQYAVRDE